jgi:hypothetical protein
MKTAYLVAVVDTSRIQTKQLSVRILSGGSLPSAVRGERPNPALAVGSTCTDRKLKRPVTDLHLQACSEFTNNQPMNNFMANSVCFPLVTKITQLFFSKAFQ